MKRRLLPAILLVALLGGLMSCEKTEQYPSDQLTDYFVMEPGKTITYRLDSLIFINFGQKDTTISYQAKDVVDASYTDQAGQPAWRVIRYLRDLESTDDKDWQVDMSYQVKFSGKHVELLEDNLTYRKLQLPITMGFSWQGNNLLPTNPFRVRYQFSNDNDIRSWDYMYDEVGGTEIINNKPYEDVVTVFQAGDSVNVPVIIPNAIGYKDHWVEKYAKNIGLVYKEVVLWEYQPANGTTPSFRAGFGIRMSILDHN
ncbi:MAG: hypothetical protein P0Y53_24835 [Candidatus Pseudobacter hemicellulosilyticus]|uniref:Uncharacterized protein n=1 Tax=Candidatus Pseudobacter hemicellulosilyticus TaxID=3121375 RepID=A0AAJ5WS20_9BACT|nr:MAG: hypothetical protein P0Y53_24835 [Pseudobacter sp.]